MRVILIVIVLFLSVITIVALIFKYIQGSSDSDIIPADVMLTVGVIIDGDVTPEAIHHYTREGFDVITNNSTSEGIKDADWVIEVKQNEYIIASSSFTIKEILLRKYIATKHCLCILVSGKSKECRYFNKGNVVKVSNGDVFITDKPHPIKTSKVKNDKMPYTVTHIHQTWKTNKVPEFYRDWPDSWKRNYPTSSYKLWTDEDNLELIKRVDPSFVPIFLGYDKGIKRADAARYFYMYEYGGLYADLDQQSTKCMNDLLNTIRESVVLGVIQVSNNPVKYEVSNSLMISKHPKHPFWAYCIQKLKEEGRINYPVLRQTGPKFLKLRYREWIKERYEYYEKQTDFYPDASNDILTLSSLYFFPISWRQTECTLNINNTGATKGDQDDIIKRCVKDNAHPDKTFAIAFWTASWQ